MFSIRSNPALFADILAHRLMWLWAVLQLLISTGKSTTTININTVEPWTSVSQNFQSMTLDANLIAADLKSLDFSSEKLWTLCRGLQGNAQRAEVYLRIGGGKEDRIVYQPTGVDSKDLPVYVLNNTEWDTINAFVRNLRWKLVFGLNVLTFRKSDGSWDPSNVIELLRYTASKGYLVQYELGNEPNHFKKFGNITVPADQLARDFALLKVILQTEARGEPMLIGPDVGPNMKGRNYLTSFLESIEPGILDAITYHFYYGRSDEAFLSNFTDPNYLDLFLQRTALVKDIVSEAAHVANIPLWLGETSSTSGGGHKVYGMSYAAGFLYLDKLGLAAQLNVSVVFKQSLVGGWYSLLDRKTLDPSTSYWITLLHKQLVGMKVLYTTGLLEYGRKLRVYAHCVNQYGGRGYDASAVVVIAINLNQNETASMTFLGGIAAHGIDQYLLTPGNGTLTDRSVKLNGKLLQMVNSTSLPTLAPVKVKEPVSLPPLTYAFYVLPGAEAEACLSNFAH